MTLEVLFVDDDPATLAVLMARYARFQHLSVHRAAGAHQALELLNTKRFHIVVSDLSMPGMDGNQLMQEIADKWPLIRTIIITGHTSLNTMLGSIQDGAFSFVAKPLGDFSALDKAIDLAHQLITGWLVELERLRPSSRPMEKPDV